MKLPKLQPHETQPDYVWTFFFEGRRPSDRALARKIGCARKTVARWMADPSAMRVVDFVRLCAALGMNPVVELGCMISVHRQRAEMMASPEMDPRTGQEWPDAWKPPKSGPAARP